MESSRADIPWPHAATLVLAADSPRQRRWAVVTAIDIVRKLAAQRPKVVIADLQMRTPSSLAASLGIEEGTGIVNVLLRGASFSASAHRPESESFYFLTLGTEPPPREVLFRHPRWQKIASKLAEMDAHLFPCVSADDWLEVGPIPGFEPCIVLNGTGDEIELPEGARRLAEFLAPPEIRAMEKAAVDLPHYAARPPEEEPTTQPMAGPPTPPTKDVEEERDEVQEPVEAALGAIGESGRGGEGEGEGDNDYERDRDYEREPEPEGWPAVGVAPSAPETPRPKQLVIDEGFVQPPVSRPRRRRSLVPGIAVAVAAVAVVVIWRLVGTPGAPEPSSGLVASAETTQVAGAPEGESGAAADEPGAAADQPGAAAEEPDQAAAEEASPGAPEAAGGATGGAGAAAAEEEGSRREEISLPYSVAIASYSSFDDAVTRQRAWARGKTTFYVAPTVVRGVVYYRVFAGTLHDRAEAESLMTRLVADGVKESARDWDVRPARLAFLFGTFPSARDARAVIDTLVGQGVPAYLVAAGDGAEAYHVYAGGYEKAEDASPLRDQIERAGLEVELVERVGLPQR